MQYMQTIYLCHRYTLVFSCRRTFQRLHRFRQQQRYCTMSSTSTWSPSLGPVHASPFTQAVVRAMRKLYPESLADKTFDNTGLLLEAPFDSLYPLGNSVLLTVDLTRAVALEAIEKEASVIIAYHPIIFRGLKSLTLGDPQQQSLLQLAQQGVSVYSPHTAVDAVPGGMADWLCDIVVSDHAGRSAKAGSLQPLSPATGFPRYSAPEYPRVQEHPDISLVVDHSRRTIHQCPPPVPEGFESAGMGRIVTFSSPEALSSLISRIGHGIGSPAGIAVAVPQSATVDTMQIRTVGVCPGSGAGVLMKGAQELPDLLLTGELSHHDALSAIERGSAVITLFHSNTERGHLRARMQDQLRHALRKELASAGDHGLNSIGENFSVDVSQVDRDPYGISIRME